MKRILVLAGVMAAVAAPVAQAATPYPYSRGATPHATPHPYSRG